MIEIYSPSKWSLLVAILGASCGLLAILFYCLRKLFKDNEEEMCTRSAKDMNNDKASSQQERNDILADVYGNTDDCFDVESPQDAKRGKSDDVALKKAWEAISRMDSDDDEIDCLVGKADLDRYVNDDDELDRIAESFSKKEAHSLDDERLRPGKNSGSKTDTSKPPVCNDDNGATCKPHAEILDMFCDMESNRDSGI